MEGAQSALRHRLQFSNGQQVKNEVTNQVTNKAASKNDAYSKKGDSPPQVGNPLIKITLFVVLIVHTLLIYITIKTMKMEKIKHKLKEENIIFITEIMKLLISSFFYLHENKFNLTSVRKNITDVLTKKRSYVVSLTVPSIMYYFQNIFFYISMSSIPIPLFQLLYQFRILVVVIFTYILLKRRIKISQLISIVFLFLSLVCLKDYNLGNDAHKEGTCKVLPLKDNDVGVLRGILLYNMKKKYLNKNTRFDFSTLWRALKRREVFQNMLKRNSCPHFASDKNHHDVVNYSRGISTDGAQTHVEPCKVMTIMKSASPPYGHPPQHEYTPQNMSKPKKNTRNNIIIGVLTTFLATFTSGFSSVFLESLYLNYRYSFWFQNMCLAFFTIILSLSTSHLDITSLLRRFFPGGDHSRENTVQEEHRPTDPPPHGEEQPDDGPPPNGVTLFLSNHFNSVREFLYVALLIVLNSVGGIITSVYIKHVGSFSRFFVTPFSLLFNTYISSIYFKDFRFTMNYFISLVFVSFSLFFYFRGHF
ncbi:Uncharacterized protein PCOAH_00031220 [Plasmodium coatneyi]|uniref:UDP-N-acetyl glucosamine:UMP antiporter n=1 Tax=Plasmodium coatneyi TaxID=208452 RepID=A0A1B1E0T6_9APIC|nr:Uncharacterized protein PCOAH_00031220 [Plasmodium coatneyi]ANQ08580.1 Uncharacterized protein PCOAH_00031220 [Plasmodium coatneyi]